MLPLLVLSACTSYQGTWDLTRLTVGDVWVTDAGFLELNETGPCAVLWRYRYDGVGGTFEPEPDPTVYPFGADPDDLKAEDGSIRPFVMIDGTPTPADLVVAEERGRRLVLEDPEFLLGAGTVWELSR